MIHTYRGLKRKVLSDGWIQLVDYMGGDIDVVNSARISYNKQHREMEKGDEGLINFLMQHRHGTPFEAIEFHFQIKAPLPVVREWQRHRIASYNEVSGRYVELALDSYIPDNGAIRTQVGKAGAYNYEKIEDENVRQHVKQLMQDTYDKCYESYKLLLDFGVAKELARFVLPQGLYTEFRFKTNARSLMNFISLRNADNAMYEIREYAKKIEESFSTVAPITCEAFIKNGRVAP